MTNAEIAKKHKATHRCTLYDDTFFKEVRTQSFPSGKHTFIGFVLPQGGWSGWRKWQDNPPIDSEVLV